MMKWKKIRQQHRDILLSLLLLLLFSPAYADNYTCTFSGSNSATLPAINVSSNDPIGTVLSTASINFELNCSGDVSGLVIATATTNTDYGETSIDKVRLTAYPGIGIQWRNYSSNAGSWSYLSSNPFNSTLNRRGLNPHGITTLQNEFNLIKVGDIKSGIIPAFSFDLITFEATNNVKQLQTLSFAPTTVTAGSCTVDNNNIPIDMGNISANSFHGVGSTAHSKAFSISLSCINTPVPIKITLSTMRSPQDSSNGVLALNENDNSADGIGIQILYNDQPIAFDTPISYGTTSEAAVSIPFKARYYQTASAIKSGYVEATMVFTMSYE